MKHRQGYLFKRGKGKGRFYVAWRLNGKLHMKALRDDHGQPITTKEEAEQARARFMAPLSLASESEALRAIVAKSEAIDEGLTESRLASTPPLAFTAAWERFMQSDRRIEKVKAGKEVLENYERQLADFGKWVAENHADVTALNQVTLPMAKRYRRHLVGSGRSPNTINKYLAALALIWGVLNGEAHITENPWTDDKVGRELKDTAEREAFTAEEVKKICEKATGDMQTLFALAAMTGLRLKDCCLLKWGEVNLDTGEIARVPAKTRRFKNSKVRIPMPAALQRILSGLERDNSGYVLSAMAQRYTKHKRELIGAIQNHIEACGVQTRGEPPQEGRRAPTVRGFHSFRHFFISAALQTGASTLTVRKLAGHSSQWMQDKYAHVIDRAESRKAVALLADSIDGEKAAKVPPEIILAQAREIAERLDTSNAAECKAALLALLPRVEKS
jgi:integrase